MIYINRIKIFASLLSILLLFALNADAQWNIPKDATDTKLPTDPTHKLVKTGKGVFNKSCIACHGTPGEGKNMIAINATELGTADYQQKHNAGETFYQINEGNGGMPSFKDQLSEEDKWCVVYYIKSFDKGFEIFGKEIISQKGTIDMKKHDDATQIFANISITNEKGETSSPKGIAVQFYVKRYFGQLPLGDAVLTNQVGTAVLDFPENIPGNEKGELEVIAEFKDKDAYGNAVSSIVANYGTHLEYVNITNKREMWGANNRVPLWILFSYISVTLGVWLVIGYVAFQLIKLKKLGK